MGFRTSEGVGGEQASNLNLRINTERGVLGDISMWGGCVSCFAPRGEQDGDHQFIFILLRLITS